MSVETHETGSGWDAFPARDQAFLNELWNRRAEFTDADKAYDIYKESAIKRGTASESAKREYLTALKAQRPDLYDEAMRQQHKKDVYYGTPALKGVAWRVYVNAVAIHAPAVSRFASQDLRGVKGVMGDKLADYMLSATTRDTILIYTESRQAAEEAVEKLGVYLANNSGHFVDEIVGLTEHTAVPGVSLGQDPPPTGTWGDLASQWLDQQGGGWLDQEGRYTSNSLLQGVFGFSFSMLRAHLIYAAAIAATGSSEAEKFTDFKNKLVANFAHAGISPAQPAQQGTVQPSIVGVLVDEFFPKG